MNIALAAIGGLSSEFITAQIIGFIATAIVIVSFQFKSVKTLLVLQICSSFIFAAQLFIMGAFSGMACNILGALLRIFVCGRNKKWVKALPWKYIFAAAFLLSGALFYTTWYSLIPAAAMVVYTFAVWSANPKTIRIYNGAAVSPMWLIYNISIMSIPGIITEVVNITSISVSWLRFYSKKTIKEAA